MLWLNIAVTSASLCSGDLVILAICLDAILIEGKHVNTPVDFSAGENQAAKGMILCRHNTF